MRKNNQLVLLLFFAVLLSPLFFAWAMVNRGSEGLKLNHHGDLIEDRNIEPAVFYDLDKKENITSASLAGKWWLVYVGPQKCLETCHDTLYNMRQIRTALGKDAERVERLFVAHPDCPKSVCEQYMSEYYPQMRKTRTNPENFTRFFTFSSNQQRESVGEIYVIDPFGNIMMHYDPDCPPKDILSDLKRLLRVSRA